jgi:GxxExxY protein
MEDVMERVSRIRLTAYDVHLYLGTGFLEKVYENALAHRLRKAGFHVAQQYPINVYDEDGTLIGDYVADLFIDNQVIVELKAVKAIAPEHEAQLLHYLKATQVRHGLLVNFGSGRFQIQKYIL